MWMYLGLLAALFLGLHNLCKKHAVQGNEVFPVLLGTITAGFLLILPFYIGSKLYPEQMLKMELYITDIPWKTHGFIIIKSAIMAASWVLAYQALKYLPITIVTPIRSAGPFFTFIGAITIYQEKPNFWQWIGFFLIIFSVFLYSRIGKKEGIIFKKNKWIFAIIGATFLGASSGLYDKFLIQTLALNPQTLQFWFCFYTILILLIILSITWFPHAEKRKAFKWRWTIPMVGVLLQIADYFYFKALQDPEALIMLLSAIKRSQIIIAVVVGGLIFKEQNKRKKLIPLVGIMAGVFLILYT
ncbi:DMT family transporter [Algibacter amylolyticus]|uniref:DMT family transporter n=1 Tax=Algibacter amylolyticus TaxID=1608400 RepID=A0A5M7B1N5_9FLAO|nr:DMT family transporter [Algibacter amylolyticus]KAA5821424.1 DMT family transporter [Algibacter amylolyticus]MBB5268298.1 drug/metabolite transporter (DMT)-like permease [Algibacter amylolyticus]TSJ72936.1 DMT family transporter [Algibacter amylolyticus]